MRPPRDSLGRDEGRHRRKFKLRLGVDAFKLPAVGHSGWVPPPPPPIPKKCKKIETDNTERGKTLPVLRRAFRDHSAHPTSDEHV